MKILSIEPTPSPNAMKCNVDISLPAGKSYNVSKKDVDQAPPHLRPLLAIEGVKSVFQVADFLSIERFPKADWEKVLADVGEVLGQEEMSTQTADTMEGAFAEVEVWIQKLKGIPIQLKLVKADVEQRFGLPDRFMQAAFQIQSAVTNAVFERKWVEQPVRYGEMEEVGEQVVEEIAAAYDQERLDRMVDQVNRPEEHHEKETEISAEELMASYSSSDWKERYAALEQYEPKLNEMSVLARSLDDEKAAIRRLAIVYFGILEDPQTLPYLIKGLRDSSPIVRRTAGDSLSDLGDPAAIPAMCEALQDKNKLVRWRAARFLYEVGDESALTALQQASNDPEFEVRMQVQIARERIEKGEEASGTVWQQMTRRMKQD